MIEVLHERFLGPATSRLFDVAVIAVSDAVIVDEFPSALQGPRNISPLHFAQGLQMPKPPQYEGNERSAGCTARWAPRFLYWAGGKVAED